MPHQLNSGSWESSMSGHNTHVLPLIGRGIAYVFVHLNTLLTITKKGISKWILMD